MAFIYIASETNVFTAVDLASTTDRPTDRPISVTSRVPELAPRSFLRWRSLRSVRPAGVRTSREKGGGVELRVGGGARERQGVVEEGRRPVGGQK